MRSRGSSCIVSRIEADDASSFKFSRLNFHYRKDAFKNIEIKNETRNYQLLNGFSEKKGGLKKNHDRGANET